MRLLALVLLAAGSLPAQSSTDARTWVNQGVQAFKNARYGDALKAFQKAVDLEPFAVTPRLYLATAYMQQFIPGAQTPENNDIAERAEAGFRRVLELESGNKLAMASLASLALNRKNWDAATDWYRRLLAADPNNKEAYYSLAFITWSRWYPAYAEARTRLGMRPEDPGPLRDPAVRTNLRAEWWSALDEAIWNLNRALELDPQYADAMAYMNLLIRERADLRDNLLEYRQDTVAADQWVSRAIDAKKAPVPQPAPGPAPQQIRVGAAVQQSQLVRRVEPVYPPLALQAGIRGVVVFNAVIGKDGAIQNLTVVSGHPLLAPAAIEAVKQWVYRPTLLNGNPIEVATQIEVPFPLPN